MSLIKDYLLWLEENEDFLALCQENLPRDTNELKEKEENESANN